MQGQPIREHLRRATAATLATLDADTGHPYASLVEMATLPDARPVLLLSGLARHTHNLIADPRASLLVDDRGTSGSLLASSRVTLIGSAMQTNDAAAGRRYLARYPDAAAIAALGDFAFWVLDIDHAHAIAGFGRIGRVAASDILLTDDNARWLANQEAELVASVNARLAVHKSAVRLAGVDAEGLDLLQQRLVRVPWSGGPATAEKIAQTIASFEVAGIGNARPRGSP